MNYEEKYKKALKSMRDLYNKMKYLSSTDALEITVTLENTFPELKESEDERIKKEIIQFLQLPHPQFVGKRNYEEWISWLEKQSDKNIITPQWMIDFLKEHRRHFATSMDYDEKKETDGKLLAVIKWLEGNPQIEQKPAWSEEDEKMFDKLYEILYIYGYSSHPEIDLSSNEAINLIYWLKSLKPNHWKPSEEQMSMLLAVLNDSNNITSESVHIALKSLYQDLLKL